MVEHYLTKYLDRQLNTEVILMDTTLLHRDERYERMSPKRIRKIAGSIIINILARAQVYVSEADVSAIRRKVRNNMLFYWQENGSNIWSMHAKSSIKGNKISMWVSMSETVKNSRASQDIHFSGLNGATHNLIIYL